MKLEKYIVYYLINEYKYIYIFFYNYNFKLYLKTCNGVFCCNTCNTDFMDYRIDIVKSFHFFFPSVKFIFLQLCRCSSGAAI